MNRHHMKDNSSRLWTVSASRGAIAHTGLDRSAPLIWQGSSISHMWLYGCGYPLFVHFVSGPVFLRAPLLPLPVSRCLHTPYSLVLGSSHSSVLTGSAGRFRII
jgi:hypothetical protein